MKKYDVIIYGATGFAGRQVAAYMATKENMNGKWAIAGRDAIKLERLQKELKAATEGLILPYMIVSSEDAKAIDEMAASTKVILNTAGPFLSFGEKIVESCVENGTDYVDITGETPYARKLIDRFHNKAKERAIRIIPFCGFDSIPSDIGTLYVVDLIRQKWGLSCKEVQGYFQFEGMINGGSWATAMQLFSKKKTLREASNPGYLNPKPNDLIVETEQAGPRYVKKISKWTAPFFMSPVNTRVVRRSHALAEEQNKGYGKGFRYQEALLIDDKNGFLKACYTSGSLGLFSLLAKYEWFRKLAIKWGPKPGDGPSEDVMENGYIKCLFVGTAEDNRQLEVKFFSKGDPGNRSTAKLVCESAIHLVETPREQLPGGASYGGVLTPATGLGIKMVDRLRIVDVLFE